MITVSTSKSLLDHLQTFSVDGSTVADVLFEGGRLSYPGRRELEYQLGTPEPYTLELEARTISGLPRPMGAAIRMLSAAVPGLTPDLDPTLELLWAAHVSWPDVRTAPSPDRLVAALTAVELLLDRPSSSEELEEAADILVTSLYQLGFPPTSESLEELFDGAFPACVGLGLVDVP